MQIIPPPPLPPSASSPMQQQTAVQPALAGHGVAPITQNAVSAMEKSEKSQTTNQRKRRQDQNAATQEPEQEDRGEHVNISV